MFIATKCITISSCFALNLVLHKTKFKKIPEKLRILTFLKNDLYFYFSVLKTYFCKVLDIIDY